MAYSGVKKEMREINNKIIVMSRKERSGVNSVNYGRVKKIFKVWKLTLPPSPSSVTNTDNFNLNHLKCIKIIQNVLYIVVNDISIYFNLLKLFI